MTKFDESFVVHGAAVVLRITRCRACGSAWFPAREQCSNCASLDVVADVTSSRGIAYASTVVRVGPPRFQAPYTLAYVDVDGVRVLVHVAAENPPEALAPGTPVELVSAAIGADDDGPIRSYAVRPAGAVR